MDATDLMQNRELQELLQRFDPHDRIVVKGSLDISGATSEACEFAASDVAEYMDDTLQSFEAKLLSKLESVVSPETHAVIEKIVNELHQEADAGIIESKIQKAFDKKFEAPQSSIDTVTAIGACRLNLILV